AMSSFSLPPWRSFPSLPPFPTRRSSDLLRHLRSASERLPGGAARLEGVPPRPARARNRPEVKFVKPRSRRCCPAVRRAEPRPPRSEEHTSELQSLTNLVCRLLLAQKKRR